MAGVDISLIVCTRNRATQLGRCLESLAALSYHGPWELVLVDNGSADHTAQVIDAFSRTAPMPVKHVLQPVPGLANARNAGLAAAAGEIVGFTDDDCYPQPDLLQRTVAVFADPAVGYAGGRIRLYDSADYPITVLERSFPMRFPPRTFVRTGHIMGANMAFRRRTLDEIGGFDPLFGSGALFAVEDTDAAARASLRGWAGCYAPEMVVFHHHGRKAADVPALWKSYDLGRGAYHMKLLLRERAWLWFLRGNLSMLKRLPARPGSVVQELIGEVRYLLWAMKRTRPA